MKRTNEAFKDEVFRRYRTEVHNRRNLRIYVVSTCLAFLLVSGFALSLITGMSLPELVASWFDALHSTDEPNQLSEYFDEPIQTVRAIYSEDAFHDCNNDEASVIANLLTSIPLTEPDSMTEKTTPYAYRLYILLSTRALHVNLYADGVLQVQISEKSDDLPVQLEYRAKPDDLKALFSYLDRLYQPAKSYDALTEIFEGQTSTKISYWKRDYSLTIFRSTDSRRIASLIAMLDQIPAEAFDNRCSCGALETETSDTRIRLNFENGGYCYFGLDAEHKHVYYHYYNPAKSTPTSVGYLRTSDADLAKLYDFLQVECEALAPLVTVPSPEEYLSDSFHHLQVNGKKVNEQYNDLIVSQLKETLADLPLVISPSIDYSKDGYAVYFYTGEFDYSVAITIYADDGLIRLALEDSPFENYYYLSAPSMELHELSLFLNECSAQEENPAMPSLKHYLGKDPSGFYFYESAADREYFYHVNKTSDRYVVADLIEKLRGMSWTLVSETIEPNLPASDGMKITLDLGIHIILEFDSSGRVLCKGMYSNGILITTGGNHPIYKDDALRYDAVYSLPPAEMEEFTAYVYALSNSADRPVMTDQLQVYLDKAVEQIDYRMVAEQSAVFTCTQAQITQLLNHLKNLQNLNPLLDTPELDPSGPYLYFTYTDGVTAEFRFDSQGYLHFILRNIRGEVLATQWYTLSKSDVTKVGEILNNSTPPETEPPVTEPPVTEPPVTEPPVTEPPVTEKPSPIEAFFTRSILEVYLRRPSDSNTYITIQSAIIDELAQKIKALKITEITTPKTPDLGNYSVKAVYTDTISANSVILHLNEKTHIITLEIPYSSETVFRTFTLSSDEFNSIVSYLDTLCPTVPTTQNFWIKELIHKTLSTMYITSSYSEYSGRSLYLFEIKEMMNSLLSTQWNATTYGKSLSGTMIKFNFTTHSMIIMLNQETSLANVRVTNHLGSVICNQDYQLSKEQCNALIDQAEDLLANSVHTHEYIVTERLEPTCTTYGYVYYFCPMCELPSTEMLRPLDHEYTVTDRKEATCTDFGEITYVCRMCGNTYQERQEPFGHDYGDASCTSPRTCTHCGHVKESAPGHNYVITHAVAATCTTDGSNTYTCQNCNHSYVETIPMYTHNYVAAACYAPKTCTICHDTIGEALGHTYQNGVCTSCGLIQYSSEGLQFWLNADGKSYHLDSLGTCTDTEVIVPNVYMGLPVTKINNLAFYYSNVTKVVLPDTITSIERGAFCNCYYLESITLPKGLIKIGEIAFSSCEVLTEINIPDSVTTIEDRAFANCNMLTSVIVPNSVTSLGQGIFSGSDNLKSVTLPTHLTEIKNYMFQNCSSLVNVTIPDGVTSLGDRVFMGCTALKKLTLPNSIQSIGAEAFQNCTGLESITLPDKLTSLTKYMFKKCTSLKSITIPVGVVEIPAYAFAECESLQSVTIPNTVTSISAYAFTKCTGLKTIVIPNSVKVLNESVFEGCTGLESITLSNQLTSLSKNLFKKCTGLKSFTIPVGIVEIREYAFAECASLENVTISNTVEQIYDYAFTKCTSLKKITIPDTVEVLHDGVFADCTALESVTLSKNNIRINHYLFQNCTALKNINLPDTVNLIEEYAFYGSGLESITIPGKVARIGNYAFAECKGLTHVIIPGIVSTLGTEAFAGCENLQYVVIPSSVYQVGQKVFKNTPALQAIYCDLSGPTNSWSTKWLNECTATVYWKDQWQYVDGIPTAK